MVAESNGLANTGHLPVKPGSSLGALDWLLMRTSINSKYTVSDKKKVLGGFGQEKKTVALNKPLKRGTKRPGFPRLSRYARPD